MQYDELVKKYPFISNTIWEVPIGWENSFIPDMCEEILQELEKNGIDPKDYEVIQVKEKFGSLRWYYSNGLKSIDEIINRYTLISETTCCGCGKPATLISKGWICPWCDDCAKELKCDFVPIKRSESCGKESLDVTSAHMSALSQ